MLINGCACQYQAWVGLESSCVSYKTWKLGQTYVCLVDTFIFLYEKQVAGCVHFAALGQTAALNYAAEGA